MVESRHFVCKTFFLVQVCSTNYRGWALEGHENVLNELQGHLGFSLNALLIFFQNLVMLIAELGQNGLELFQIIVFLNKLFTLGL